MSSFFFSSRRRHTRSLCDWSSDVCSSDLQARHHRSHQVHGARRAQARYRLWPARHRQRRYGHGRTHEGGRDAGLRRSCPGAGHGRGALRHCHPLHGEPAARHQRAVHADQGDKDAVRGARVGTIASAKSAPMLDHLKENNRVWAERKVAADASFFMRLENQQAPEYLWIGCSDSRVPANEIVGLDPGELFVHRNVANLAPPQDANYLSVLQFAVDVLKVKHVMVVGHYGCGGVRAAVDGKRRGLVDHWLHPIREVAQTHRAELAAYVNDRERLNRLCELNVIRQVRNVASDVFVQDAWARGQPLSVHGWVYSLSSGLVTDLTVTVTGPLSPG